MVLDRNESVKSVWIDEHEKIASFHHVEGYLKYTYTNHEFFMKFLCTLQQRGFRFQ